MNKAIIKLPAEATPGEVVTVKVLIRHPMETGHRRDRKGEQIPRNIINSFTAHYDGVDVFRIDLFPGVAANPFLEFRMLATSTGDVVFTWTADDGRTHTEKATIRVA